MYIDLNKFKNRAIRIIERENLYSNKQKIIAFLLDAKGRIISEGWNLYNKSHPRMKHFASKVGEEWKEFLHAEVSALVKNKSDNAESIVVLRISNKGELLLAKPCPICDMAIKAAGIKHVIHS